MKKLFFILFLGLTIVPAGLTGIAFAQTLTLDKANYNPGETITVTFTAPASFPDNAWVGIIPANVPHGSESTNDKYDLAYEYLKKRTSGSLTFKAPNAPGAYDVRMHDTDAGGKEVVSVSFTVGGGRTPPSSGLSLGIDRTMYKPGEQITVTFTAPDSFAENAWIGLIPANVPHGNETENDKFDLAYQYLQKKTSGLVAFQAPAQPGEYTVRMHDTDADGREVASISFTVK